MELLDSAKVSGKDVAAFLGERGLDDVTVKTLRGEKGKTDFVRVKIPGTRGKTPREMPDARRPRPSRGGRSPSGDDRARLRR